VSLDSRLTQDLKAALRSGDDTRRDTVRMLMSALKNRRIDNKAPLERRQELSIVQREIRVREESADVYRRAGNEAAVERYVAEAAVLEEYRTELAEDAEEQLTEDELRAVVQEAVVQTGAASPREMGKVMSAVMPQVQGRADNRRVSELVRETLSGGGG